MQVSLYVCSVNLSLLYQGMPYATNSFDMSNGIPGMISEVIFVVDHDLFDKKYGVTISISNALRAVNVTTSPLSKHNN